MASPIKFKGATNMFHAPRGQEHRVSSMHVFLHDPPVGIPLVVSCWQFSQEEWLKVLADERRVYLAMQARGVYPTLIGAEDVVREHCADVAVWKR